MPVFDLSFNPRDPQFDAPGLPSVRWGVQLFTTGNLYQLNPEHVQLEQEGTAMRLTCRRLAWPGGGGNVAGYVEVRVVPEDGALVWRVQAQHEEPIKCIKLLLHGLPEDVLSRGWWHATSSRDEAVHPTAAAPLHWTYPQASQWLTPWACAGGEDGAVCISVRDAEVREKRLYVHSPPYAGGRSVVEIICDEDATRWDRDYAAPPIHLRVCSGASEVDADWQEHLRFVEHAYGLRHWDSRPDVPAWLREIRLVVNLHGQHWTGYVFNTFDRMAETLRFITQHIPGEQVLAYLPGWEGRYYFQYPFFQPGEDMGGHAGFRRLADTSQELGVRLMPMFGAHGANVQMYPDWERAAFRSRTNRIVKLFNFPDWDSDRSGEDDQIFLNTAEPTFRRHLLDQISPMVERYGLDIVYLDTTAAWFNDPRYNLYNGYRTLLGELRERHPGLAVAGEAWTDALLALFPINLSWLGVHRAFFRPELLARYGRAIQHLNEGAPGAGSTGVYEGGFAPAKRTPPTPGHLPSLSIVHDTLPDHADEVVRICRAAGR